MREEHTVARVNIKDQISWLLSQYTYNAIPTIYNAILNTMQYHSHRMQCNNTRERSPIDNFDGGCNNFDGGCNNIKKDYVYCDYCDYMIWRDPWKVANHMNETGAGGGEDDYSMDNYTNYADVVAACAYCTPDAMVCNATTCIHQRM